MNGKAIKRISIIIIILILLFLIGKYFYPTSYSYNNKAEIKNQINFNNKNLKLDNKASILMNLDTNQVIYQKNIDQALPVYSVSKLMFLASANQLIKDKHLDFNDKVIIDSQSSRLNSNSNFSSANLKKGQVYTIEELFKATMLPSGNDAALALANYLFKSHQQAVKVMNENAKAWGMQNASFVTTSGLDGKYLSQLGIEAKPGNNKMSIRDSVILVKKIKNDYPIIIKIGSLDKVSIGQNNDLVNTNKLLNKKGFYGLKTGSNSEEYSYCIISLRKDKNKQDILTISYDARERETLYQDIEKMNKYLDSLKVTNLMNDLMINPTFMYAKNKVDLGTDKNFYLYHLDKQMFEYELEPLNDYNYQLNKFTYANKGNVIGKLEIKDKKQFFNDEVIGLSDVVVKNEVKQVNNLEKAVIFIKEFIMK